MSNSNCTFFFNIEIIKLFNFLQLDKFSKLIQNLNSNKTSLQYDIPIKMLKEDSEICSYILYHNFNNSLSF